MNASHKNSHIFWRANIRLYAIIFFILAAVLVLSFYRFFAGDVLYEDDVTYYYLPAFHFYSSALKEGEDVSLTPYVFSGFPLSLTQSGGFFDPVNYIIFKFFPYPTAYHLRIVLNYWLAGVFIFLFLRSINISIVPSLVGVSGYISAQHIIYGANILRSNSFFLLPGLLFVLENLRGNKGKSIFSKENIIYILLGLVIFVVSFIGGYTQLNLYSLTTVFFYLAFLYYLEKPEKKFWLSVSLVFIIGALILYPYAAGVMDLVQLSARANGLSWEEASRNISIGDAFWNLSLGLFLPRLSNSMGTIQSLYVGLLPFLFAVFGIFFSRRNSKVFFFTVLFVFYVLSAFPYPFFWLMHKLPIFRYFRFPTHWLFPASFALSILGALGCESFLNSKHRLLFLKNIQRAILTRKGKVALIAILSLSFLLPTVFTIKRTSMAYEQLVKAPWVIKEIEELSANGKEPFRVYSFYPGDAQFWLFVDPFRPSASELRDFQREIVQTHNSPALWKMESIRGFDNLLMRRYARVLNFLEKRKFSEIIEKPEPFLRINDAKLHIPEYIYRVLGMMNVKYMWSVVPLAADDLVGVIEPKADTILFKKYRIPLHLYENKLFLPRVFSPVRVEFFAPDEDNFEKIFPNSNTAKFPDFRQKGFVECKVCDGFGSVLTQDPAEIKIIASRNNTLKFITKSAKGSWVIVANSYLPGWKAYIDKRPTSVYYGNYIYQAVYVPAGEHMVEFVYK